MLKVRHPGPVEVPVYFDRVPIASSLSRMPEPIPNGPTSTSASTSASASSSPPVKRACDACHRRKVKCIGDGTRSCKNCCSASLTCTYNAIPQKKGPKGSRAKVISELRETQRQSQLAATRQVRDFESPPHSPAAVRRHGLLSMDMITACVEYFFTHLQSTQPILYRSNIREAIVQMESSVEAYCMIVSLCAYMMIQPNMVIPLEAFEGLQVQPQSSLQLGQILLEEAIRVRKEYDYIETPTVLSIITSFFFFGSNFCLDRHNTAWFHLREATTLAQIVGMNEESNYQIGDPAENARRRRLYWLLFVTERAYALQQHKPLTLYATINTPTTDEAGSEGIPLLHGFVNLVNLFRPFDDTFVGLWNKARSGCTPEWLAALQTQLSDALPSYLHCTEAQAVDLRCSQQWLRTMVWQLSISHGFLSSAAADSALSFKFPIEVSRDLVQSASQFSQQAMEVHGIGLIEKLFDVACTLTDVMAVIPPEQYTFDFGPREYLHQLMNLISTLRGGQQRYMPMLLEKVRDTLPSAPGYNLPATLPSVTSAPVAEDLYEEGSHGHTDSAPFSSAGSTPFGSPLSTDAQSFVFSEMVAGTSGLPMSSIPAAVPLYAPAPMHDIPTVLARYENLG